MFGFLLPIIFTFFAFWSVHLSGLWTYSVFIIALYGFALIDLIIPKSTPSPVSGPRWFFNSILYVYSWLHVVLISYVAYLISIRDLQTYELVGLILSVGTVTGGIGITLAHELVHRKSRFEKFLGQMILVFVCYGHFTVAHVIGHHRNVGTPQDPATAKKGQSLYAFYLQALPGVFLDALKLRKKETLLYVSISFLIALTFLIFFGLTGLIFFLGQSLVAALLLETVDYIEHYGLVRNQLPSGSYEKVQAHHSWDSSSWFTGKLTIHLQRHSDHHLHVIKEYPQLELLPQAKQLPVGYPGMILIASVPSLWFKMMDPKL